METPIGEIAQILLALWKSAIQLQCDDARISLSGNAEQILDVLTQNIKEDDVRKWVQGGLERWKQHAD